MGLFTRKKNKSESAQADQTAAPTNDSSPERTGPFDIADAHDEPRIDFGAIQVPPREGMQISLEMEQQSRRVSGLNLSLHDSAVQVNVFAAPKSSGLWDEVRKALRGSIVEQGGTTETREGSFGTELHARVPLESDGARGPRYRPLRFVGIDGPRWFVRAVVSGAALRDPHIAENVEDAIRSLVIVRGTQPMAPKEVVELTIPHDAQPRNDSAPTPSEIDPAGDGPSIAVVG